MRLLLDTNAILFALAAPEQLSPVARMCIENSTLEKWVSVISFWEIAIKVRIGKLVGPSDPEFYANQLRLLRVRPLPVTLAHSLALFQMPLHHRDPFDRLLIAQALEEKLTIVTRDREFASYDVPTLW